MLCEEIVSSKLFPSCYTRCQLVQGATSEWCVCSRLLKRRLYSWGPYQLILLGCVEESEPVLVALGIYFFSADVALGQTRENATTIRHAL